MGFASSKQNENFLRRIQSSFRKNELINCAINLHRLNAKYKTLMGLVKPKRYKRMSSKIHTRLAGWNLVNSHREVNFLVIYLGG